MSEFLQRLKQRKLVQWALAYGAAAFALLQGIDIVAQQFGWPEGVRRGITLALVVGFFVTLVLAWYHGERGAQRISGTELVIIGLVLAVGGGVLWRFSAASHETKETVATVPNENKPTPTSIIPEKSIAVLPFENLSDDKSNSYFSDGITEEILNALAQIPDLKVAARRSAFQLKGSNLDVRKIGQLLGVAHILEGSLQKVNDQVRITVQLVDVQNGLQAWSEKYDRKLDNVFALEDEIAKAIATKLRVQLTGGAGQELVSGGTSNPRAHELYLRGLTLLSARGPGMSEAAKDFQEATDLDATYARAWGALAVTESLLPAYGFETLDTALARADAFARRALSLERNIASAYVAIGIVNTFHCRWPEADEAFRQALLLAPGDAEAVNQYAQFLATAGQLEPALTQIEKAQELDPLSPIISVIHAGTLLSLRRDKEAAAQIKSLLAAHPDFPPARAVSSALCIREKMYPEAEREMRAWATLQKQDPDAKGLLVRGMADPAQRATAIKTLDTSPDNADLRSDPLWYASYLVWLGEGDRALDQLETYAAKHNSSFGASIWDRPFDPLHNEARFKAVLAKLALPYNPASAPKS